MCILYNQRDATYTKFFIIITPLHVSGGFSAHHQQLIKLYVQPWVLSFSLHVLLYQIAAFVLYSFLLMFRYWYISFACLTSINLTFMEPCIARCVFYITNEMQLIQCSL
jgi:hypothetical protein